MDGSPCRVDWLKGASTALRDIVSSVWFGERSADDVKRMIHAGSGVSADELGGFLLRGISTALIELANASPDQNRSVGSLSEAAQRTGANIDKLQRLDDRMGGTPKVPDISASDDFPTLQVAQRAERTKQPAPSTAKRVAPNVSSEIGPVGASSASRKSNILSSSDLSDQTSAADRLGELHGIALSSSCIHNIGLHLETILLLLTVPRDARIASQSGVSVANEMESFSLAPESLGAGLGSKKDGAHSTMAPNADARIERASAGGLIVASGVAAHRYACAALSSAPDLVAALGPRLLDAIAACPASMSSQPLRALLSRLRPGSLRHQAMPTPQQAPLSMSIRSDAVSGAMSGPSVKSLATAVSQTHHLIREAASAFAGLAQLPQGYAQRARAAIGGVSGRQGMIRLAEAFVAAAMKAAESGDAIIAVDTALSDAAARGGADKLRLLHARMSGAPGGRGGGGRTRGGGRAQGGSGKRVAPTRAGGGGVGADAGGDEVEGGSRRDFGGGGHGQGHGAGQKRSGDPHGDARAREVLEGLRNASRHLTRSVTPFLIFLEVADSLVFTQVVSGLLCQEIARLLVSTASAFAPVPPDSTRRQLLAGASILARLATFSVSPDIPSPIRLPLPQTRPVEASHRQRGGASWRQRAGDHGVRQGKVEGSRNRRAHGSGLFGWVESCGLYGTNAGRLMMELASRDGDGGTSDQVALAVVFLASFGASLLGMVGEREALRDIEAVVVCLLQLRASQCLVPARNPSFGPVHLALRGALDALYDAAGAAFGDAFTAALAPPAAHAQRQAPPPLDGGHSAGSAVDLGASPGAGEPVFPADGSGMGAGMAWAKWAEEHLQGELLGRAGSFVETAVPRLEEILQHLRSGVSQSAQHGAQWAVGSSQCEELRRPGRRDLGADGQKSTAARRVMAACSSQDGSDQGRLEQAFLNGHQLANGLSLKAVVDSVSAIVGANAAEHAASASVAKESVQRAQCLLDAAVSHIAQMLAAVVWSRGQAALEATGGEVDLAGPRHVEVERLLQACEAAPGPQSALKVLKSRAVECLVAVQDILAEQAVREMEDLCMEEALALVQQHVVHAMPALAPQGMAPPALGVAVNVALRAASAEAARALISTGHTRARKAMECSTADTPATRHVAVEARISSALRQVLSSTVAQRQSRTRAQAPPAPSRQRPRVVADPVFDPRSVVMAAIAAAKHGGQAAHVVVPSSSSSSVATTPRVAHRAAGGTAGATGSSFRDKAWERQADAGNRPPHGAPTPGTEAWSARDGVSGDDGGGHGRGVDVEHGKTGPAPARFEGEPSGSGTADAAVEAPRAARRRLQTAMDKALTGMDRFKHPSAADRPLEGATEQDSDQARAMGVSRDWGASPPAGDARVSDRAALNAGSGPLAPGRSVQRRPERGGEGGKAFVQWLCTGELEGDADPAMEVVIRVLEAASGGNRTDPGALDAAGAELATAALLAVEGLQRGEGATTGSEGTGRAVDSESSCTNVDSEGTGSALERVEAVAEALRGLGSAPRLAALTMWCHGSCRESAGFERVGRDCGGNS